MRITCPICGNGFDREDGKIRSMPQNKYYWGVVVSILADNLGYNLLEMHEILKGLFLFEVKHIQTKKGVEEVVTVKSTADLDSSSFEKYLSDIRTWASSELNCFVPLPHEEII